MTEYEVVIPETAFSKKRFHQDDLPGVVEINSGLKAFEPRIVFSWHLSLIIDCEETDESGLPTEAEETAIATFEERLNLLMQGENSERPNSLYFARVTWNKTRELAWRVFDPEMADSLLQELVAGNEFPRAFDYKMERDPEWKLTEWHLNL